MDTPKEIREWLKAANKKGTLHMQEAQTIRTRVLDKDVFFSITNPKDTIQRVHVQGHFYESEELHIIAKNFPIGGRFLDIGANIGNHSLYILLFLHASLVVPVEPNGIAAKLYVNNIYLNRVEERVNFKWLGYGVSNEAPDDFEINWRPKNLGGAQLKKGDGDIQVIEASHLLQEQAYDMIKIDVEGMENKVLESLLQALGDNRPVFFVEVDNHNKDRFLELMAEYNYEIKETFRRYDTNENYLMKPAS